LFFVLSLQTKRLTMGEFQSNSKQQKFNEIRGCIAEINDHEKYCSLTILCGHENPRSVNISVKKSAFEPIKYKHKIGDVVVCSFYVVSNKRNERWFTSINLINIEYA